MPLGLALASQARAARPDRPPASAPGPPRGSAPALAAGLGARLLPRFEVVLDHVDLDALVAAADLGFTAEGAVDVQTPKGKVPAEVTRRAKAQGKPVLALAGSIGRGAADVHDVGIDTLASILPVPMPLEDAVEQGAGLLADAAGRAMRLVLVGCAVSAA